MLAIQTQTTAEWRRGSRVGLITQRSVDRNHAPLSHSATAWGAGNRTLECAYPKVRGSKPRSAMAFWASGHQQHGAGKGTLESAPAMLAAPRGGATVPRGHKLQDGAQSHQQRSGAVVSVLGSQPKGPRIKTLFCNCSEMSSAPGLRLLLRSARDCGPWAQVVLLLF